MFTSSVTSGIPLGNSSEDPGGEMLDASWPIQLAGDRAFCPGDTGCHCHQGDEQTRQGNSDPSHAGSPLSSAAESKPSWDIMANTSGEAHISAMRSPSILQMSISWTLNRRPVGGAPRNSP